MIVDTHVHISDFQTPDPVSMLKRMDEAGIDKTCLLAETPFYFEKDADKVREGNRSRLARLMEWCKDSGGRLVPIYYINVIEPDAIEQVDRALDAGAAGFKVICETHYPGDERAMPVYQHIADAGKSILFHSGILYDYGDNGNFNRPCNWECMFGISNIKFALAHISWPWCDELISLYGKFSAMAYSPLYKNQKLYIDMTPGTPDCYRREVINRIFDCDYDHIAERLMYGTDNFTGEYEPDYSKHIMENDRKILTERSVGTEIQNGIFGENALEFWGIK